MSSELDHFAYHERVKLRCYNGRVSIGQACSARDASKVLRKCNPEWTRTEHRVLASRHAEEGARLDALHLELLDKAHQATFSQPHGFCDYRITAIGREEYPEDLKAQLRQAPYGASQHYTASRAHLAAA